MIKNNQEFKDLYLNYLSTAQFKKTTASIDTNENEEYFNGNNDLRNEILEEAKDLSNIKSNLKLIFKNAWIDIFPSIINLHQEYFYEYFSTDKVRKCFSDYIREPFIWIMTEQNTTLETSILNEISHDIVVDENKAPIITRFKNAKPYYIAIKSVHPILSQSIYDEAIDGYQLRIFKEGDGAFKSYSNLFDSLKTKHGKCTLITKVINKIKIKGYTIDIKPVLNNDLLSIFESCLKSEDFELINFIGGYIEYLIGFSKDEDTIHFKNRVVQLLNQHDNIPVVNAYRKNMYLDD